MMIRETMTTTLADAWLHTLDPVIVQLPGAFALRWYGLAYLVGFTLGYLILRTLAKRDALAMPPERVADAMLVLVLGVVVGGRVGYALFYDPSLLTTFRPTAPFWDLLAFHRGGMASHGGMLSVAAAAWWIARRERMHFLALGDALALATPPGLMFGRLANFINGELLGKIVSSPGEAAPSWSVRFPQELTERPDEVLSRLSDAQALQLQGLVNEEAARIEAELASAGTVVVESPSVAFVLERLIARVQDGDASLAQRMSDLLTARHPSQLYQAAAEGLVVFVVLLIVWRKPRRAGTVGGWFLITYGVGRIVTEVYRLPDLGVPEFLGLSRGQWLSAAMIVAGVGVLAYARVKKTPMTPGWRGGAAVEESTAGNRSDTAARSDGDASAAAKDGANDDSGDSLR